MILDNLILILCATLIELNDPVLMKYLRIASPGEYSSLLDVNNDISLEMAKAGDWDYLCVGGLSVNEYLMNTKRDWGYEDLYLYLNSNVAFVTSFKLRDTGYELVLSKIGNILCLLFHRRAD